MTFIVNVYMYLLFFCSSDLCSSCYCVGTKLAKITTLGNGYVVCPQCQEEGDDC
jgi:hypothetical protein